MSAINSPPSKPNAARPLLFILYAITVLLCWASGFNLSEGDIWYTIFWLCSMTIFIVYGCAKKTKKNADLFVFSVVAFLILFTGAALFVKALKNSPKVSISAVEIIDAFTKS